MRIARKAHSYSLSEGEGKFPSSSPVNNSSSPQNFKISPYPAIFPLLTFGKRVVSDDSTTLSQDTARVLKLIAAAVHRYVFHSSQSLSLRSSKIAHISLEFSKRTRDIQMISSVIFN